jgi:DHA2 family multidrug resistance protein-like MFS transporter
VVGSLLLPVLVRRIRPAHLVSAGLALAAVGFGVLTQVEVGSGILVLVIGSVIYSLALSPVVVLATDMIVGSAPVERAGAASAISETSAELGGALGIAVLGSIGTAIYRSNMATAVPADVPLAATEAARNTLGGALAAAAPLPDHLQVELLGAAREAFTQAFALIAGICAIVALATSIVVALVLRRAPATSESEARPQTHTRAGGTVDVQEHQDAVQL